MISYGYVKDIGTPIAEVLRQLPALLEKEGFRVVSAIAVAADLEAALKRVPDGVA